MSNLTKKYYFLGKISYLTLIICIYINFIVYSNYYHLIGIISHTNKKN